jgi:hypothetical protein
MPFRVLWTPDAEIKLEQLIKASPEPGRIAAAVRQIDRFLVDTPVDFGESRYETIRVGFVIPLGVQFEVMDDVQTVIVHHVWRVAKK